LRHSHEPIYSQNHRLQKIICYCWCRGLQPSELSSLDWCWLRNTMLFSSICYS